VQLRLVPTVSWAAVFASPNAVMKFAD